MLISYQQQVVLLTEKHTKQLNADLARISHLTDIYRQINQIRPKLFYWQYTALETGIHSSYPGHGGYPADYDPRKRSWYLEALQRGSQVRQVVTDATTGKPILTLSQPVFRPDGSFAGVTALDVAYEQLLSTLAHADGPPCRESSAETGSKVSGNDQLGPIPNAFLPLTAGMFREGNRG